MYLSTTNTAYYFIDLNKKVCLYSISTGNYILKRKMMIFDFTFIPYFHFLLLREILENPHK